MITQGFSYSLNGFDNRLHRELERTTKVFKYLRGYFPSALILLLGLYQPPFLVGLASVITVPIRRIFCVAYIELT